MLPYGVVRLLAGLVFTLGLILVVVAGAELFTGNNLIVMAWASRRVATAQLLGELGDRLRRELRRRLRDGCPALLRRAVHLRRRRRRRSRALAIGVTKTSLGFGQAIALGMLCNALVCLAVWLTYGAHTTTDKILAIIPPIAAFVAAGFEHSVANMYFISIGAARQADEASSRASTRSRICPASTWCSRSSLDNLLPVTIGNILGGAVMVGAVYWLVYLRPRRAERVGG